MASWYQSLSSRSRQIGSQLWQPRSTSSIIFSKGLLNAPGENNCFLNSAVQVLWHLDVFRKSFREMGGHACMGKACIFCALKVLFTQLKYSERQSLPPDALRKALAVAFADEHRFQLGCMDDAAECFENILTRIHFHLAYDIKEDLCDAKHCISHRKFAMTLYEHSVCTCGATSEPFPFTQMVHYVSCSALCNEAAKLKEKYKYNKSVYFGQVLRNAGAVGDIRECPSECGKKINIRRILMNCPDVVAIGLVWDSDRPEKDHIMNVIQCLGTSLRMPDLFNSVLDEKAKEAALHLVGVVTYYGKHYSTFFYNTALRIWLYFDDATVKQVGPNWTDVVNRCMRGHSQPLLLLFANPHGTPVSAETAPTETTLLSGYELLKSPTAVKPRQTFGIHDDRSSISNSNQSQSLQPVMEYDPEPDNPIMSGLSRKAQERNVVEIGHDALKTVVARQRGGQSSLEDKPRVQNSSLSNNGRHPAGALDRNQSRDRVRNSVQHSSHSTAVNNTSLQPRSLDDASVKTSEDKYSVTGGTFAEDLRNGHLMSLGHGRTRGNIPPPPRSRQVTEISASQAVNCRQNGREHPSRSHVNADLDRVRGSQRLERHESWSERPNEARVVQARQYPERSSLHRHNSFSQGEMASLQPCSLQNAVQEERENVQNSYLTYTAPYRGMRKSSSMAEYMPNQEMSLQFGSVPNLSQGLDNKTSKSRSLQNIAMAKEGILANAIKNQVQLKRASTSSLSTDGRNSFINDVISHPNPGGRESLSKFIQESSQTAHFNGTTNRTSRDAPLASQKRMHSWSPNSDSQLGPHTHSGKNERDSVASRDSGYRSRDRSSASSGSVHSFETLPEGGHHNTVTREIQATSSQDLQLNCKTPTMTAEVEAFCDEVCQECADLQARSKVKGEDGDLATALALCTTAVTKLKKCLKLNGVSAQRCKALHSQYNSAVLQSRNLHRRLTLLRRQDSSLLDQDSVSFDLQTEHGSGSQPCQPAQELDLINFHERSIEGSRVDRLKHQLQELYLQKPDTKQTNVFPARQDYRPLAACGPTIPQMTITQQRDLKETLRRQDINRRSPYDKDTNLLLVGQDGSPTMTSPNKSPSGYVPTDLMTPKTHRGDSNLGWQGRNRSPNTRDFNSLLGRQEDSPTPTLNHIKSPICLNSPAALMPKTQGDSRGTSGWQGINRNHNARKETYTGTGWFPDSHVQPGLWQDQRGSIRSERLSDGLHADRMQHYVHNDMSSSLSGAKTQSQYTDDLMSGNPQPVLHSTHV